MIPSKINALVFSDVHLFHDKTKTEHILFGLQKALADHERLSDVDIIFISGDLFDHSVFLPNKDISLVLKFLNHLLNMCHKYDIVLRVLEGTPSHDWKQSRMIEDLNKMRKEPVDAKHVEVLSIEHIEKFGIDVLYVPDEWGTSCADTFEEVKMLLQEKGLEQVDLSIMHGCFNYQFPVNLVGKPDVHDENSYLSITKYLVIIGHYHTHSKFERIVVPGSFDRLKHGEEEAKGYLKFSIWDDGRYEVQFVENKVAMIYKTLDFRSMEIIDIINFLKDFNKDNKEKFVKIIAEKDDPVFKGLKELKALFPNIHFSIDTKKNEEVVPVKQSFDIVRPTTLTAQSLEKIMQERLTQKYPDKADGCMETLRRILNNE